MGDGKSFQNYLAFQEIVMHSEMHTQKKMETITDANKGTGYQKTGKCGVAQQSESRNAHRDRLQYGPENRNHHENTTKFISRNTCDQMYLWYAKTKNDHRKRLLTARTLLLTYLEAYDFQTRA